MTSFPLRKIKLSTLLLIILTSMFISISFLPHAKAVTTIVTMTPTTGAVGTTVSLNANISSGNGTYAILFDENSILTGTITGSNLTVTFPIPDATAGNHTLKLHDVATGENATQNFTITTAYYLNITTPEPPQQLQEGDHPIPIAVNVTGGDASTTYAANVTVKAPTNITYSNLVNITTSTYGNGTTLLNYPEDFPTGANTSFTGTYRAAFNDSVTGAFFIGLTNSSEYHRLQTVDIKAVRQPSEDVNITIAGTNVLNQENVTADNVTGIIHYTNWAVPSNATMGTYAISITSLSGKTKTPADTQNFTIPGYATNITMLNLAGETVQDIDFQILDNGTLVAEQYSNAEGLVQLLLEYGNYTRQAYYNTIRVGEDTYYVTGESSSNFTCSLTNLRITVKDKANNTLPAVAMYLTPVNETFTTDINGTTAIHSLLPNVTYTFNVSRYDTLFNITTIASLPQTAWYDVPITCPTMTLQVNVTNANGQPINNALIVAQELMGGLYYQDNTTADGLVTLNCTLGRYLVSVYANGATLNITTIDVNETIVNLPITVGFYGLDVSVRVVDYFGQAIPNVNVTLQWPGAQDSKLIGSDGLVSFNNIIGGTLEVTVRLSGQSEPCVITTTFVDNSTTIEIKIEKYTLLAGMLVETSHLLTAILIVLIAVVLLAFEILRRRRHKPQENEKIEPE